jgi:multisubunit Na+/H+ antiporter MnhF subunit
VNAYELAATALTIGIAPCALVCALSRPADGLAALTLAGTLTTLALLCLAEGYHRGAYFTVALVAPVVSWIGGLVLARFLGRLP